MRMFADGAAHSPRLPDDVLFFFFFFLFFRENGDAFFVRQRHPFPGLAARL